MFYIVNGGVAVACLVALRVLYRTTPKTVDAPPTFTDTALVFSVQPMKGDGAYVAAPINVNTQKEARELADEINRGRT